MQTAWLITFISWKYKKKKEKYKSLNCGSLVFVQIVLSNILPSGDDVIGNTIYKHVIAVYSFWECGNKVVAMWMLLCSLLCYMTGCSKY